MFEQIPDNNKNKISSSRARRRRKRKKAKKELKAINNKTCPTMSTWAENFTAAATWQLKHQIAYWKAKAKALEYENGVLHDIIRTNNFDDESSDESNSVSQTEETENNDIALREEDYEDEDNQVEDDFEVSEEFIQFLASNAKYKEEAKRERERLAAKTKEEALPQPEPQESSEEKQEKLKDLYGSHWQKISALEIGIQSEFIQDIDLDKPMYWPNIPFNF